MKNSKIIFTFLLFVGLVEWINGALNCPNGFVAYNNVCVQAAQSCATNFVFQGGVCLPIVTNQVDNAAVGYAQNSALQTVVPCTSGVNCQTTTTYQCCCNTCSQTPCTAVQPCNQVQTVTQCQNSQPCAAAAATPCASSTPCSTNCAQSTPCAVSQPCNINCAKPCSNSQPCSSNQAVSTPCTANQPCLNNAPLTPCTSHQPCYNIPPCAANKPCNNQISPSQVVPPCQQQPQQPQAAPCQTYTPQIVLPCQQQPQQPPIIPPQKPQVIPTQQPPTIPSQQPPLNPTHQPPTVPPQQPPIISPQQPPIIPPQQPPLSPPTQPPIISQQQPPPSPPTQPPPASYTIPCPPGTILIDGVCRLIGCGKWYVYINDSCVRVECPEGTYWSGEECIEPEANEFNISFNNTIKTQINRTEPAIVVDNVNNFNVTIVNTAPLHYNCIDYNNCEENNILTDNEYNEISVDDDKTTSNVHVDDGDDVGETKCCTVITPRVCKPIVEADQKHWRCYSRRYRRCGNFCIAPTIYLKAPEPIGRPETIVLPPMETRPVMTQPIEYPGLSSYDCSGCISGQPQYCASYCHRIVCPPLRCSFYDQRQYCSEYPGQNGCQEQDGCYSDWCSR